MLNLLNRVFSKVSGMTRHCLRFIGTTWALRKKSIYIFDLDNTLGDTFPTLVNRNPDELARLAGIKPFKRMCELANRVATSASRATIVLTARQYYTEEVTKAWLASAGIKIPERNIVIVLSPMQKIWLLRIAACYCKRIVFIDDMSFGKEKGILKFYDDAIKSIPSKVHYIAAKTIEKFNR